jgi:hypothetical protein
VIQRRTHRAPLAMGSFAPTLGSGYAAPGTRWCPRCACRLSRYALQSEVYCAPCAAVLHPWVMPEMRTRKKDECPDCGGLKLRTSKQCGQCRDKEIKRRKQPYNGGTCLCGRWKNKYATMCRTCYLESVA